MHDLSAALAIFLAGVFLNRRKRQGNNLVLSAVFRFCGSLMAAEAMFGLSLTEKDILCGKPAKIGSNRLSKLEQSIYHVFARGYMMGREFRSASAGMPRMYLCRQIGLQSTKDLGRERF